MIKKCICGHNCGEVSIMKNSIMGWSISEVKSMLYFVKTHPYDATINSLTLWANKHKKQPFSVRNYFYKLIKTAKTDNKTNLMLCSLGFDVHSFGKQNAEKYTMQLLIKILNYTEKRSVYSVCLELAKNDAKLAQKLQNKYRNTLSNNPVLVEKVLNQLHNQGIPTRITFAQNKIVSMPNIQAPTISEQDLQSLILGVVNLIRKNTETCVNNQRNQQVQIINNNLQKALIDVRRKNVLLEELKKENEKIKQNLEKAQSNQQKLMQERDASYLTIKQLLESKKQQDLTKFIQKLISQSLENGAIDQNTK